jgi:hypothetical protein
LAEESVVSYWRVIYKGSIGTVETWSTSIAMGIVGISPDSPDQIATDGMANALRTATTAANLGTNMRGALSNVVSIDIVRVERRAEDESVLNVAEALLGTALTGTGIASKTPQDAVVLSLRTATPGPRGRGRMYMPAIGAQLTASFSLSVPTPASVASDAKTWIASMKTAMDGVYIAGASALRVAPSVRSVTDHRCRDVTSIQVGSILDTQRRRRDILPESYVSVAYP